MDAIRRERRGVLLGGQRVAWPVLPPVTDGSGGLSVQEAVNALDHLGGEVAVDCEGFRRVERLARRAGRHEQDEQQRGGTFHRDSPSSTYTFPSATLATISHLPSPSTSARSTEATGASN